MGKVVGLIPGEFKSKTFKLVFAATRLSMQHLGVRAKTGGPRIRIMCLNKEACLAFMS